MASPLARELDRVEETAGEWRRSGARRDERSLQHRGTPSRLKSESNVHHQHVPPWTQIPNHSTTSTVSSHVLRRTRIPQSWIGQKAHRIGDRPHPQHRPPRPRTAIGRCDTEEAGGHHETDWQQVAIFGAGLALGLALGAGAALLTAPQSGEETRAALRGRVKRMGRTTRRRSRDAWDELRDELAVGDGRCAGAEPSARRGAHSSASWSAKRPGSDG